jgi:phenylalanyl-tRNA synthetase alpha chain
MSQPPHRWQEEIESISSLKDWEHLRIRLLGKSGEITALLKELGTLPPEQRRERGSEINALKEVVITHLEEKKKILSIAELNARLQSEAVDVTLSSRPEPLGTLHPITQTIIDVVTYFSRMGFTVAEGPDIEDEEHNFNALNIPEHHPARQSHDTFYMKEAGKLLRTHTSPVQIRTMRSQQPPIRILAPGRTYRCDHDATHTPMFHQIEGLVIDKGIHMGHLKGCIIDFCRSFFGIDDLPVRFRPSFFPFTEPSAEVDIGCSRSQGSLKIGTGSDWLEILGCGMVHPKVLQNCGINPDVYQGFAFGMGIERLSMLKYSIPDIRAFFDSDSRWLKHYGFSPAL